MAKRSKSKKTNDKPPRRSPKNQASANNDTSPSKASQASTTHHSATDIHGKDIPIGMFVGGLLCLAFAIAATLMLVLDHFGRLSLPGCGAGGGCAAAAASWWGKVPGTSWPISFVGLAYFTGLMIAWSNSRRGVPTSFRTLVRLGVLMSVMYVVVLIVQRHLCYYCLATHAANLAFWILLEKGRHPVAAKWRPVVMATAIFALVTGGLFAAQSRHKQFVEQSQEAERQASVAEIIAATNQKTRDAERLSPKTTRDGGMDHQASRSETATTDPADKNAAQPVEDIDRPWTGAFTGRYRWGPEQAQVRIVMFTDYQCPDCRRVEGETMVMLERQPNVSLSVKHFPMCSQCNSHFLSHNLHPNACWAARAAETAGMMRGNDGFWQMHRWLFNRKGAFTNEELHEGLLELGYDPDEFIAVMRNEQTLELVLSDIDQAIWLGLHFTPMIFINGVELKGVFARQAVPRTVKQILAQNPPFMTADVDQPPPAIDKFVGDWREQVVQRMPPDRHPWARGPDDAKMKIVMWADYQEKYTPMADRIITEWMKDKEDVQYSFRHFPFNQKCNPVVSRSAHRWACRASAAAETAGLIGGGDGYWKMHHWLMTHQRKFSEQTLREAVVELGFDVDAFFTQIDQSEVTDAIMEDVKAARPAGPTGPSMLYRGGIPTIYINGKVIPRWRLGDKPALKRILSEAYASSG